MDQGGKIAFGGAREEGIRLSIVVPARDEAATLPLLLDSIAAQRLPGGFDHSSFEVLILTNNCTDGSVQVVEEFQQEHPHLNVFVADVCLPDELANIGYVRRQLMAAAFERVSADGVIMTTDADTVLSADWIAANLAEIERGADAVGGRILMAETELVQMDKAARDLHIVDEKYRLLVAELESVIDELPFDSGERHHQHFNASFAVTADAYRRAGGIPEVEYLEDCAFFERLERLDMKVRHSPDVIVYTSARTAGRSKVGLSNQIGEWQKLGGEGKAFLVESAASVVDRLRLRRRLREIWNKCGDIDTAALELLADELFVPAALIGGGLAAKKTFGEFYGDIIAEQCGLGMRHDLFPDEPVDDAASKLASFTQDQAAFRQTSSR